MQYVLHHLWLTSCHAWSFRVGSAPVVCVYNHAVSLPDRQDVKVTCVLQQGRSQLTLVDKGNGMSKSNINTLGNPFGICVFIPLIQPSCVFIPLPAIASTCLRPIFASSAFEGCFNDPIPKFPNESGGVKGAHMSAVAVGRVLENPPTRDSVVLERYDLSLGSLSVCVCMRVCVAFVSVDCGFVSSLCSLFCLGLFGVVWQAWQTMLLMICHGGGMQWLKGMEKEVNIYPSSQCTCGKIPAQENHLTCEPGKHRITCWTANLSAILPLRLFQGQTPCTIKTQAGGKW